MHRHFQEQRDVVLRCLAGQLAKELALTVDSAAFQLNGNIPRKQTCEGADVSPPLA